MIETICDVRWEGPTEWDRRGKLLAKHHVLYALFGTHHLYGQSVLLYIGMTRVGLGSRLASHALWVKEEYDIVTIRAASIGTFSTIDDWWSSWESNPDRPYKKKAAPALVTDVESLLIYAHTPAYNSQGKSFLGLTGDRHVRIFNTGKPGNLLPELSAAYFEAD